MRKSKFRGRSVSGELLFRRRLLDARRENSSRPSRSEIGHDAADLEPLENTSGARPSQWLISPQVMSAASPGSCLDRSTPNARRTATRARARTARSGAALRAFSVSIASLDARLEGHEFRDRGPLRRWYQSQKDDFPFQYWSENPLYQGQAKCTDIEVVDAEIGMPAKEETCAGIGCLYSNGDCCKFGSSCRGCYHRCDAPDMGERINGNKVCKNGNKEGYDYDEAFCMKLDGSGGRLVCALCKEGAWA